MRRSLRLLLAALLLAACGQAGGAAPTAPAATASLSAIPAASELAVGQNRLPFGVVKAGTPVNDPNLKVHLRLFFLDNPDPNKVLGEADAIYRGQGLPFGLYVAYATFDRAGDWGVEVEMTEPGGAPQVSRVRVSVLAELSTPAVGTPAIPVKNLTLAEVPDLQRLTSDSQPDPDLYRLTVADALAAKKPFLVTFSTPGFCQTAVCAPNLKVIKQLKETFKAQINFIHVEVYPYPFGKSAQQQRRVPAMTEWKLQTEPWTFLVDAQGTIQARYEGGITLVELEPALKQLAAGQPVQPGAATP